MIISLPQGEVKKIVSKIKRLLDKDGCKPATGLAALRYGGLRHRLPRLNLSKVAKNNLIRGSVDFPSHTSTSLTRRTVTLRVWTEWTARQELGQPGDYVHLFMGSMGAVTFVNRQEGTRSRIPGEQMDFLSKTAIGGWAFGLKQEAVDDLWRRGYQPSTDLCASSSFHTAGVYYSSAPDPQAAGLDAFTAASRTGLSYAFPPPPLPSGWLDKIEGCSQGVGQAKLGSRLPKLGTRAATVVRGGRTAGHLL